ncbi:hypothetical protein [Shewanella surugensis]|uniref:RiboL-PSP-HEPN domain-containing protein n=1 Tax=Shewanella surugensis TaxID=212020 RepID=A0ABT0LJ75_9GAMM|nr:hypothetical protein [Shewanella surugensis]MCL1127759.1 hypothetical protein [Shewanella surugensis]
MENYLDKSGKAMLSATMTFDYARSAEKMTEFNCIGKDNLAWKEGPFISSPANMPDIDRSYPYCFKTSKEFAMTAQLVLGENPKVSENGGVKIPLPPKDEHESRVEPVLAKLAIIEQFELFKEYLSTFDGPINKKKRKAWEGQVDPLTLELLIELTDRRNELTHDSEYFLPTIKEAVEYFYKLRQLALTLIEAHKSQVKS